jgi:putative nucleotidyltransferase with HDIG domain
VTQRGIELMDKDAIVRRIYSKIEEIPTLSPMLQKVVDLIQNSSSDSQDVTDVISRDPSLTSKILKVSNSAYYGFSQSVDTLERAVMVLGFNMINSLAMSVGIIKTLSSGEKTNRFSRERLWIHSLAVGTLMKEMGIRFGRKEESDSLFVIGLLHDIGKVVLDQFFAEDYQKALEETGCQESSEVCEAEENYFGMDHGEVGNILLRRWNFPETMCALIALDHKTEVPEGVNAADVAMLHIADILSKEAGMGVSESITPSEIRSADTDALGVTGKDIDDLRSFLASAKDGIHAKNGRS